MDQVGLDREVLVDKVRPVGVVGVDTADLGGGDNHHVGPVIRRASQRSRSWSVRSSSSRVAKNLGLSPPFLEPADYRGSDHPAVCRRRIHVPEPIVSPPILGRARHRSHCSLSIRIRFAWSRSWPTISSTISSSVVRDPAELIFREGRVTEQGLDLRGPEVARVNPDDHVTDASYSRPTHRLQISRYRSQSRPCPTNRSRFSTAPRSYPQNSRTEIC